MCMGVCLRIKPQSYTPLGSKRDFDLIKMLAAKKKRGKEGSKKKAFREWLESKIEGETYIK